MMGRFIAVGVLLTAVSCTDESARVPHVISHNEPVCFFYSDAITSHYMFAPGRAELGLYEAELHFDPRYVDGWAQVNRSRDLVAPFGIRCVAARHAHELFVSGRDDEAGVADIIERWELPAEVGGYGVSRPPSTSPVGEPFETPEPELTVAGPPGTTYVRIDRRTPLPPTRTEVYRGNELAGLRLLVADPDGRFLIGLGGDHVLRMVTLGKPPRVSTLLHPDEHPGLEHVLAIAAKQHATEGRIVILHPDSAYGAPYVLLHDAENDGVFERVRTLTIDEYRASSYWPDEVPRSAGLAHVRDEWTEDFIDYDFFH